MKGFIKDEIPSRWDENQMTHDELLAKIRHRKTTSLLYTKELNIGAKYYLDAHLDALRAVVELHKPTGWFEDIGYADQECIHCDNGSYPCESIQAIEKELR